MGSLVAAGDLVRVRRGGDLACLIEGGYDELRCNDKIPPFVLSFGFGFGFVLVVSSGLFGWQVLYIQKALEIAARFVWLSVMRHLR